MGNLLKFSCCTFVVLLAMIINVKGRALRYSSSELVSDGVDKNFQDQQSTLLVFRGIDEPAEECKHMYGFLPCSNSILGHLFLIVVYEYLLFHAESYVAAGGEQIFKILGPGFFGASVFQILGALPESLILLASGLLNSEEAAEYVNTGVGLFAGSSILLLTIIWGTCVIVGCREFSNVQKIEVSNGSSSWKMSYGRLLSTLTGHGVTTDLETSYTARIMVLSVIPFIIIQIPKIPFLASGQRVMILVTLIISVVFLLMYFFYQIFQPWIQKRRLEYMKHEHFILRILQHVQKHVVGRILTENGAPNVPAIRRLFEEVDHDGDDYISPAELKELLLGIKFRKMDISKDEAIAEVMKEFDLNDDRKITKDEFVNGFTKWLDETKNAMDKKFYSQRSLKDLYQIFQPWIQKKRKEHEMKKHLISQIIRHVQNNAVGNLLKEDGTPNIPNIRMLFEKIDLDGDNYISQSELKELIMNIKFGKVPLDVDEAVAKIIELLDTSGDSMINEEEFVVGFSNWLNTSNINDQTHISSPESEDDIYQRTWEETDKLVEEEENGRGVDDKSLWAWFKAIFHLVVGIIVLAILAEPLIYSVQNFSKAASIPPFFISFILVPLATNARGATSAISAACRKKPRTTSLTLSEIYGGVLMNNILGFSVLLSLIYVRGLTWDFSAEVLVVVIVCAVMGLIASFRSSFPLWTSTLAYLLYPTSLLLVYVLNDVVFYS